MTGPHLPARVAHHAPDGDLKAMMLDLGKLMSRCFRRVQEAGYRQVQIDEPLLSVAGDDEVGAAVEAINLALAVAPDAQATLERLARPG